MNVTCENCSTDEFNSFNYSVCNIMVLYEWYNIVVNIMTLLLSFPINFHVIWLIVRGTGNGLAAEIFILNFSICEIFYCIECLLSLFPFEFESVRRVVAFLDGFPITGGPLFQSLICVERYLAVVHPVTFLKYKPLRYRLMCCAVAWVTCFVSCIYFFTTQFFSLCQLIPISYFAQFFLFFSLQLFCCVAVLRALKQSGPGERGREREEENHMKRRAFHLILITTVATAVINAPEITLLLLNYLWSLNSDMVTAIGYLCYLFAGLMQPLLFLYRVGKLNFMKCLYFNLISNEV